MLYVAQLRCRHPKNSSKTQGLPIAHGYSPAKDLAFSPLQTEGLVIELEGRNSTRVRSAVILL